MVEAVVSGGVFEGATAPAAAPSRGETTVHGGYFQPLPKAAATACERGPNFHACRALSSCLRTWGQDVEYQPEGADPFLLPSGGIFRETFVQVEFTNGSTSNQEVPQVGVRRAEVPARYGRSDLVIVAGRIFKVREVQKDGELGAKVFLHEVTA